MAPIINPNNDALYKPAPVSPQVLYTRLSQAARAGVAEVEQFQATWRSPEMKDIWDHVGEEIKKDKGRLLQPTGMWERDYNVLLQELLDENAKVKKERLDDEGVVGRFEAEFMGNNWRSILNTFLHEEHELQGSQGLRIQPDEHDSLITIALVKVGMLLQARIVKESDRDIPKWRVSNVPGRPQTKMELAVHDRINSRPRQWDLAYLLVSWDSTIIHNAKNLYFFSTDEPTCLENDLFIRRYQADPLRQMQQTDR